MAPSPPPAVKLGTVAQPTPDDFIWAHVGFELEQLLIGATHWAAWPSRAADLPPDIRGMSEYAVYVHARCLYELFAWKPDQYIQKVRSLIGFTAQFESPLYREEVFRALHEKAVHISVERPFEHRGIPYDDLTNQMVEIASDILQLWEMFAKSPDMTPYAELIGQRRADAIARAAKVAEWYRIDPLFA